MKKTLISIAIFLTGSLFLKAQDKLYFKTYDYSESFYYSQILTGIQQVESPKKAKTFKRLKVDIKGKTFPNKVADYKQQWHNKPISQGNTGTCWAFSTTSFMESEVYRLTKQKVKLSEMWTVYWEYVEKAKGFVNSRGTTIFEEGSEANAVTKIYKKYGIVPESTYDGKLPEQKFYNHEKMMKEMKSYLNMVKKNNIWNEDQVISTIKSILNHYMGTPPTVVEINGKKISPIEYMKSIKLVPDDYVDILSYKQHPFWKQCTYDVADNWWGNSDYYNVPLNDFMDALKKAVKAGYTCSIGGDVSEPGLLTDKGDPQVAIIPSFDIPSANINDDARQFRFSNKTTTDDHGMHCVGYLVKDGVTWFLIKDSSSGSRNNDPNGDKFGYYFFREDFVKLKMMDFMIHKDAVKDLLKKFK